MSVLGNLEIGKTGLNAAQLGQTTTGHNISNANTEGFSRQRVEQSADSNLHDGRPQGVRIDGIARLHDKFNAEKLTSETSNLEDWSTRLKFMKSLESVFQDLEGRGVLEALTSFWNSWATVADQPESLAARQDLIATAHRLTDQLAKLDQKLLNIKHGLTEQMMQNLEEVNKLTKEVADLNRQIQRIEALKGNANDLKDQRDEAIRKISEKVDINWFYNHQNMIDVQLSAGVPLVRGISAYDLIPYYDTAIPGFPVLGYDLDEGNLLNVTKQVTGGSLKGIVETRDGFVEAQRQKLKQLASSLADNINNYHAAGTGIGEASVKEVATYRLMPHELGKPLTNLADGEFKIRLLPNSKLDSPLELVVAVNAGVDSVSDIVAKINQAAAAYNRPDPAAPTTDQQASDPATTGDTTTAGDSALAASDPAVTGDPQATADQGVASASVKPVLTAELDTTGRLVLNAGTGYTMLFNTDSSGFLGRMGLNPFFIPGRELSDFGVNPELAADPSKIALGYEQNPGDNRVALAIHDLQFAKLLQNKTSTIDEFYRGIHSGVGSETENVERNKNNHQNIYDQYLALRNNVTGVNIDEEMTRMIKYQKAYDASAKYISTVDKMAETLINM